MIVNRRNTEFVFTGNEGRRKIAHRLNKKIINNGKNINVSGALKKNRNLYFIRSSTVYLYKLLYVYKIIKYANGKAMMIIASGDETETIE